MACGYSSYVGVAQAHRTLLSPGGGCMGRGNRLHMGMIDGWEGMDRWSLQMKVCIRRL
jgi:hypothetical protein